MFSAGSFIVPSIILYSCSSLQKARIPAARHHGESGECTYFELGEQMTILCILSVIARSFQLILENPTDCDKIN